MEQNHTEKSALAGRRGFILGLAALAPLSALAHPGVRARLDLALGSRLDLSSFRLPSVPGLTRDGTEIPGLETASLDRPALLHVWSSWCPTCRAERPLLLELAQRGVAIFGVNALDTPQHALQSLEREGNPYLAVGQDPRGLSLRTFGLRGVPGSVALRANRSIAATFTGPLDRDVINSRLLPVVT